MKCSGYDNDERLQSVLWGSNTVSYLYDAASNLTQTTLPVGNAWREQRFYDRAGRLTGISTSRFPLTEAVEVLSGFSLTLDPVGNPLERTRSGTLEGTETYTYDDMDRLSGVCFQAGTCPGGSDPFIRFAYDGVGNRQSETRPAGQTTYAYNAADELSQAGSTSYGYDSNGNQLQAGTRTFTWDLANRLKTTTLAATTTTYSYDAEGKRLQASKGAANSQKTNFLWDPSFPLAQGGLSGTVEWTRFRGHLSAWSAVSDLAGRIGVHVQHSVSPTVPRAVPGRGGRTGSLERAARS